MEGPARSPAARSGGLQALSSRGGGDAFTQSSRTATAAVNSSQDVNNTPIIPFSATIDGYKQRCSELEEEVAAGMAVAAAQRVEAEALRTKVTMLTEACRALDAQLNELRRRSAAEAAAAAARAPALPLPSATEPPKPLEPVNLTPCMVPELAKLLRAACQQLEEARRVGSVLQSRLGAASTSGGGKQGFTCA